MMYLIKWIEFCIVFTMKYGLFRVKISVTYVKFSRSVLKHKSIYLFSEYSSVGPQIILSTCVCSIVQISKISDADKSSLGLISPSVYIAYKLCRPENHKKYIYMALHGGSASLCICCYLDIIMHSCTSCLGSQSTIRMEASFFLSELLSFQWSTRRGSPFPVRCSSTFGCPSAFCGFSESRWPLPFFYSLQGRCRIAFSRS